jgi:hypothetical protein
VREGEADDVPRNVRRYVLRRKVVSASSLVVQSAIRRVTRMGQKIRALDDQVMTASGA